MISKSLLHRLSRIKAVVQEQKAREESNRPVLYPFKIIRYNSEGKPWFETPESKLKPLAAGEERKVLHLRDCDVADFYREVRRRAGKL